MLPRGSTALDGGPRYADLEEMGEADGVPVFLAMDRVVNRRVRLFVAPREALAGLRASAGLRHPAAIRILELGELPDGSSCASATDASGARSLADAGVLAREPLAKIVRAVASAAEAVSWAETSGLIRRSIRPTHVLLLEDGTPLLDGPGEWQASGGEARSSALADLESILAALLEARRDRRLRAIVRQGHASAGALAADLQAFLEDRSIPSLPDGPMRRLRRKIRRRPALAAAAAGLVVVGLAAAMFREYETRLASSRISQARRIAEAQQREAFRQAVAQAEEACATLRALDGQRAVVLAAIEDRYHRVDSVTPDAMERDLALKLARLDAQWESRSRVAQGVSESALAYDPEDLRAAAVLREVNRQRIAFALARTRFEEGKILSTRTIATARATAPIHAALTTGRYDEALTRSTELPQDHPYRALGLSLSQTLLSHADWARDYEDAIRAFAATGQLLLSSLPDGASAAYSEVLTDPSGTWQLGPESPLTTREPIALPVGEYLVQIRLGAICHRVDTLVRRGAQWDVHAADAPATLPEGFIWIPASPFYVGGVDDRRYRLSREVERSFLMGANEVTWAEYCAWLKTLGESERQPYLPIVTHTAFVWPVLDQNLGIQAAMRKIARDDFPIWGMNHNACTAFVHSAQRELPGADLPSEDEWELAARGVAGRLYPWGDSPLQEAFSAIGDTSGTPHWVEVDDETLDISIYGVRHLAANVAEITSSLVGTFLCVVRGGRDNVPAASFHAGRRTLVPDNGRTKSMGFRLAIRSP